MKITLKPMGKCILIEAVEPDGGKVLLGNYKPEGAQRLHQMSGKIMRVLAVGEGRMASDGTIVPIDLKPGDEVVLAPDTMMATPNEMLYGTSGQYIVDISMVVAVVEGREGNKIAELPLPEIVTGRMNTKALVQ